MSSPKSQIVSALRTASETISGETLSARLGISRVAVWKHIRKLQELGYAIESTGSGYRLVQAPDALWPWEFPAREDRVRFFPVIDSTMDTARELARGGCKNFTVVAADRQTHGRGRLQREWHSGSGGLYFTLVTRPRLPSPFAHRVNFASALTLVELLNEMYAIRARVKWPNDILVAERKLAGMLSEMEADSDRIHYVNIGLGINVHNDPTPDEPQAVSLAQLTGRPLSRRVILARFLDRLEERMESGDLDGVIEDWKRHAVTLKRAVRVVTHREEIVGTARDVDPDGALIVETEDGEIRRVVYGDCFHR